MNDQIFDDIALEKMAKELFGVELDVGQIIVRKVDVGRGSVATVFLTKKKQLFAYIVSQSRLTLGDVKKITSRMGLRVEQYLPPKGQTSYFNAIGRMKFQEVFPGRRQVGDDDLVYYRTLAPYNPALVQIAEVTNGEIYRYDNDARTKWRPAAKFMYRRISTS